MARRIDFWQIVLIIAALIILFWALLRAFGIISSPAWVEMIPYFGVGISILGEVYALGKIKRGIEEIELKVNRVLKIEERFSKLENEHSLAMSGKLKIHR